MTRPFAKQKEKIYTTEPKVSAGPPPYLVKISNNESVLSDCASIQLVWIVALENGRLSSVYNVLNSNFKCPWKCFNVWLSTCLCMHGCLPIYMHGCLPACIHGCMHVCYTWMRTCLCIYGWVRVYRMQSCLPVYSFIVVCVCLCMRAWVHFLTYAWLWECMYAHGCVGVSMQVAFNMSRMCVERKCNWFKKSQSANTRVAISFSFIIF